MNNSLPVGAMGYNPGAIKTSLQYAVNPWPVGTILALNLNQIIFQESFAVDPNCPFFYIFGYGPTFATLPSPHKSYAIVTTEFLNGGSPISEATYVFGYDAYINSTAPGLIVQCYGNGIGSGGLLDIHDPLATCYQIEPGGNLAGFIARWTALCDTVRMTMRCGGENLIVNAPGLTSDQSSTLMMGLMQQPW